jgi:replicative DNA helicase
MHAPPPLEHDRQPPWSEQAETSVLAGMLIDSDAVNRIVDKVDASMFYRRGNRGIYRAMVALYNKGDVIDVVTIADYLNDTAELESVGGIDYLARLGD